MEYARIYTIFLFEYFHERNGILSEIYKLIIFSNFYKLSKSYDLCIGTTEIYLYIYYIVSHRLRTFLNKNRKTKGNKLIYFS